MWQNRITRYSDEAPDQLVANPRNFRMHPGSQADALRGVLSEVGIVQNVIANERSGFLIDGHLRVMEALKSGQPTIPVTWVDVSEEEEALILATLDPIAALASTDAIKLDALLRDVSTADSAVQQMLDNLAIEAGIVPGLAEGQGGDEFDTTPDDGPTRTAVGDLWLIGDKHRLLVGDCTDSAAVARLMDGERASLIVTSPPYNQKLDTFKPSGMQKEHPAFVQRMADAYQDDMPEEEYQDHQVAILEMLRGYVTPNGSIFYNHKIRYRDKRVVSPMQWLLRLSFPIRQEIIWDRGTSITLNARMFIPADERIYWLRVGDDFTFNDEPEIKAYSTVWEVGAVNEIKASAAFATEIPTRCIRAASDIDDIVLDPYCGTGTTLIAAHREGRAGYGIERDPRWADVILKRAEAEGLTCVKAE
jgi:DNA modification methylase